MLVKITPEWLAIAT
ncbi:hypothetical protein [Pseudonocardia sp. MH-G8]